MATYLCRINWIQTSDISEDVIVWGYHVETAGTPPTADQVASVHNSAMAAGTVALLSRLPLNMEVRDYQVYDVVVGGPPIDEALPIAPVVGGSTPSNSDVALVVTRWVNDGLGRPFKIGRQYIGPWGNVTATDRPTQSVIDNCLDYTIALHEGFDGLGFSPVVDTKGGLHVAQPIVQYSVDNAWDTQRRRGYPPSASTERVPA